jgi:hypothetical protein
MRIGWLMPERCEALPLVYERRIQTFAQLSTNF